MGEYYTIQQGESLVTIAHRFGFRHYTSVYNHSQNAAFRKRRPNPNLVHPGDSLYIPDKAPKKATCKTGTTHIFVVKRQVRRIEVKLLDIDGEPLANTSYQLLLDGEIFSEKKTDGSGVLRESIPLSAREGTLKILHYVWPLKLDHLNPVKDAPDDGISGIQGRLRNLGYETGPVDGILGPRTRAALRDFQADHLPDNITGDADEATISKLMEKYGL